MMVQIQNVIKGLRADSDRSVAGRNAISAFLIRVLSAGLAYVTQIILARWMGSFEYGIFAYVWVWLLLLGGVATLGLNTAVIRFIPEYTEKADFERLRGLLFSSRRITFLVSTSIMLLALLGLYLLGDKIENYYILPGFLVLFCLPAFAITDLHDSMARGYSWMNMALIPPFLLRPLLILSVMLAAYFLGLEMTAKTAVIAALIATWVTLFIQIIWLAPRIANNVPAGARRDESKFWLATSFPILLMESFVLFLQNTDILILSQYRSPETLAQYYAALKTINLITFVHFAVANAVANRFSAYSARGDKEQLAEFVRMSVKWTFWPSLAGAVLLLAVGKPLLWMFGPEFTAAYPAMFILAVGLVIKAMFGPAENVLNMLGHQKLCALVLFITVFVNIILNFILIPPYGMMGAAAATSTSLCLAALLFFIAIKKKLQINIFIGQK